MANEQHLEWLKEGVEAWNQRRYKTDFPPYIRGANLEGTVLRGANLAGADLEGAKLAGADLEGANLTRANLVESDLEGADLEGAILEGTDLERANVKSVNWDAGTKNESASQFTDLSQVIGLTQNQLETMDGDTGTILPDGLHHPAHWPEFRPDDKSDNDTESHSDEPPKDQQLENEGTNAEQSGEAVGSSDAAHIALQSQVRVLLANPIRSAETVIQFKELLDYAVQLFRQANRTNEVPEDLLLVEAFSEKIGQINEVLTQDTSAQTSDLERQLKELRELVEQLQKTIAEQAELISKQAEGSKELSDFHKAKSAFAVSFGKNLGTGTAALVVAASGYLLGTYGGQVVGFLGETIGQFFVSGPPPQLPLPPATTV